MEEMDGWKRWMGGDGGKALPGCQIEADGEGLGICGSDSLVSSERKGMR